MYKKMAEEMIKKAIRMSYPGFIDDLEITECKDDDFCGDTMLLFTVKHTYHGITTIYLANMYTDSIHVTTFKVGTEYKDDEPWIEYTLY